LFVLLLTTAYALSSFNAQNPIWISVSSVFNPLVSVNQIEMFNSLVTGRSTDQIPEINQNIDPQTSAIFESRNQYPVIIV
jgi:hypothetical protein